jgi:hypothetical protein
MIIFMLSASGDFYCLRNLIGANEACSDGTDLCWRGPYGWPIPKRFLTPSSDIPRNSTRFVREVSPERMVTALWGNPNRSAR